MQKVTGTLAEELKVLGLSSMVSRTISEDVDTKTAPMGEDNDPIDGVYVSEELLNRIKALPFEAMEESDLEDLIDSLKGKQIQEDASDELKALAEDTVKMVTEVKAQRIRRNAALSAKKKKSFQCPQGFRQAGANGKCVPAFRAAGGMGGLNKEKREKKKWAKTGKAAMSKKKSARWADRRESDESMSDIALELRALVEDTAPVSKTESVRDELIGRMVDIFDMLGEEFNDKSVSEVYEEHVESMLDSYEIGRLDEDVMDEAEFLAELAPQINLIRESYRKIADGESLGN